MQSLQAPRPGLMNPAVNLATVMESSQSLRQLPNVQQLLYGEGLPPEVRELPNLKQAVTGQAQRPSTGVATLSSATPTQAGVRPAPELAAQNAPQSPTLPEAGMRSNEGLSSSATGRYEPNQAQRGQGETSHSETNRAAPGKVVAGQPNTDQREVSQFKADRLEALKNADAGGRLTSADIETLSLRSNDAPQIRNINAVRGVERSVTEQSEWVRNLGQREFNSQEVAAKNSQQTLDTNRFAQNNLLETVPATLRPVVKMIRQQTIPQSLSDVEISPPLIENLTALSQPYRASTGAQVPQLALTTSLESADWSSTFADKVQQILRGNLKQAEIRLDPPHLGKIQIKIDLAGDTTSITFISDQTVVREAIDNASARLRGQLASAGFDNVEVDVASGNEQKNYREENDTNKPLPIEQSVLDDKIDEATGAETPDRANADNLPLVGSAGSISLYA